MRSLDRVDTSGSCYEAVTIVVYTDAEVLSLFLKPEEKTEKEKTEKDNVPLAAPPSVSGDVRSRAFKRPSVKQKSDGHRFDADVLDLRFQLFSKRSERRVFIPDHFDQRELYSEVWKVAAHEEMQLKLEAFSTKMRMVLKSLDEERSQAQSTEKKATEAAPLRTLTWLRKSGIMYYDDCRMHVVKRDKREDDLYFLELQNLMEETKKTARCDNGRLRFV